jgi:hypothetical protein
VALAGALLIGVGPTAGRASAADDPASTPKPGASQSGAPQPGGPQAGSPQLKPKQQTAKPGPAKSTPKTGAAAAKPSGSQPRSIAGDLLDDQPPSDLDNQLLDGLPPARQPPAKSPASQPAAPAADGDRPPVTEGPVLGAGGADPLFRIGEQMREIEHRLDAHRQDDTDTPALQEQIVDELARLIEKLEEQQNSQQSSASSKAPPAGSSTERKSVRQPSPAGAKAGATPGAADNRPAKESTERLGKNEVHAPTADEIRGLMKDVWGQLPAHEREQMLQSPPEQFLPKYELLLEKYYKRLADEQQHRP